MRSAWAAAAALLALPAAPGPARADWVASWGSAMATLSGQSPSATTVRQFLRLSLGGSRLRVRVSNETGSQPLVVGAAHIGLPGAAPGSVDPASDRVVTFGGATGVVVPAGAPALSDPVDLPVTSLSRLAVTLVLSSASPRQVGHLDALETTYLLAGDHAGDAVLAGAVAGTSGYALSGVDVSTPGQTSAAVGVLGDSITEGFGSTVGAERRWTDRLAERLAARTGAAVPAVVNAGLAGNALATGGPLGVTGASALARPDGDVLSRPGLRWLVLFEGINDIILTTSPGTVAADIVAADRQVIARAHDRGVKVYGATLTPFAGSGRGVYSFPGERARTAVNDWILHGGEFDGTLDFDAVVRDASSPRALHPSFDSGDHLHPNDAGYRAIGDSIPLALFR